MASRARPSCALLAPLEGAKPLTTNLEPFGSFPTFSIRRCRNCLFRRLRSVAFGICLFATVTPNFGGTSLGEWAGRKWATMYRLPALLPLLMVRSKPSDLPTRFSAGNIFTHD